MPRVNSKAKAKPAERKSARTRAVASKRAEAKPRDTKTEGGNPAPPEGARGPGWIDPEIQSLVRWRDGDIVVSVPVKSGTTWTMNIVHQLRAGGDPDLQDVYVEVPWLELVPSPDVTREQRLAKFTSMPRGRRAFK